MAAPLYLLIELSLFFIGVKRLHRIFQDADVFFAHQKHTREVEKQTLQLAGMYAVSKNLDQARIFFCEREPTRCTALSAYHRNLLQPLQQEILSREEYRKTSFLEPVLRKQNPTLQPASWPNWVAGLRYLPPSQGAAG